ncbi:hypothetical protein [Pseudanabaena sp. PCC 6802]|nr:hypothetical protein [Pseudanabaena sp. PCC 6802]
MKNAIAIASITTETEGSSSDYRALSVSLLAEYYEQGYFFPIPCQL